MIEWQFDIVTAGRRKYWTRIKSRNGRIVWTSEIYTTKNNAIKPVMKLVKSIGINKTCIKEKTK